jgi:protocatechuate 3,4-dioxygenase beta subunit
VAADAGPLLVPTPAVDDGDDDAPPPAVCAATADNIEGPFWKPGAPHRAELATSRDAGERLVLAGAVRTTGCAPLAGAELDLWHADARGDYDNDGFRFRGTLVTGADGRWLVSTIVPGRYLNGRRYRPAHVHAKLRAPGHKDLTTQLYFAGDPYNDGDPFIVPSLIMTHRVEGGARRAGFDFVLEPA